MHVGRCLEKGWFMNVGSRGCKGTLLGRGMKKRVVNDGRLRDLFGLLRSNVASDPMPGIVGSTVF
jgi:hypothetical protein